MERQWKSLWANGDQTVTSESRRRRLREGPSEPSFTLVLAHAGASLPVLLIFSLADTPFSDAINFEAVAEAIVAMLVGSIGLIAAVPITTALAALLATRVEPAELVAVEHAHQRARTRSPASSPTTANANDFWRAFLTRERASFGGPNVVGRGVARWPEC